MITTRRFNPEGDRYFFDFGPCNFEKGFAQIDTSQDASYFGLWANPERLLIVSYIEGDITIQQAENRGEFIREIRTMAQWNKDGGFRFAVDGMCNETIIGGFTGLGLADLLH